MEVLLVSPVRPIYLILAKTIPYFILSLINLITILLLSKYVLAVPINGSLFLLSAVSMLFVLVSLSLGLMISTLVETQVAAMLISGMVFMMPVMILSGMMFPVENMPLILKGVAQLIPAKWFIEAVRKVMIQGVGFMYVLKEIGVMLLMMSIFIGISVKKFKHRLD
jgi:ABC-2 type transport system permease protein